MPYQLVCQQRDTADLQKTSLVQGCQGGLLGGGKRMSRLGLEEIREEKDSHSSQYKKLDRSHVEVHGPSKRENEERVHKSQGNGWTA